MNKKISLMQSKNSARTRYEIRERIADDAESFCKFLSKLDNEAEYMLYEKDERNISTDIIKRNIENIINNKDACYIALDGKNIIGFIIAVREKFIRTEHAANIVVGILEEYCGKGIGYELFQCIFKWAEKSGVKRLELTVIKENARAVNLYKKSGFKIEGLREMSTFINGKYYDEYYMAKLLE